ncbi:MAM and LDL-receptor class A domain-containing protein 1-like isoform X1 [Saccostrea cucullata]|uniref:MAM and LDL-receptor class A domain-containing protein 1-like isoform X1 n=1 Tax=Saccostrea cuccullata TaxID=36930 RepID=UPI002ED39A74
MYLREIALLLLVRSCFLLPVDYDVTAPEQNLGAVQIQTNGHIEHLMDGETLVEGDIIKNHQKSAVHHFQMRMAVTGVNLVWTGRIIPYIIDTTGYSVTELTAIKNALGKMASLLQDCITFKPRQQENDYLRIQRGHGCYSSVGRQGGEQKVSLGPGCTERTGTIYHELMHALGFWHEHTRPDRDRYIVLNKTNIIDTHVSDFEKMNEDEVTILGDYDYTSVMHYSPITFAKDKVNPKGRVFTINRTWNNPFPESQEYRIGQRDGLSTLDIQKIRKMYRCSIKQCSNPEPLINGKIVGLSETGSTEVGVSIVYSCNYPGTILVGPRKRFCKMDGTWSGFQPQCLNPKEGFIRFCSFDSNNFCGWTQDPQNSGDWILNNKGTETENTGPTLDHTAEDHTGYYIYMESSRRTKGDKTRLLSPLFHIKNSTGRMCLELYYHMHGKTMGSLNVFIQNEGLTQTFQSFSISGDQGSQWKHLETNFTNPNVPFKIVLEGVVGPNFLSDIGIDDVIIMDCSLGPGDQTKTQGVYKCDFLSGFCGWTQETTDIAWQINSGDTPTIFTGPECDRTDCQNGTYLYIETSGTSAPGSEATLRSPLLQRSGDYCLTFFYSMYGADIGELRVEIEDGVNKSTEWIKQGDQGNGWHSAMVPISGQGGFWVLFVGKKGFGYRGDIAIDDVTITENKCKVDASCDFDSGFCGWQNDVFDDFDWSRMKGSTATPNTGPRADHTSTEGYYLYIESSAPRVTGDTARIYSPFITSYNPVSCLVIHYHMFGEHVAHLHVLLVTIEGHEQSIWKHFGNHGDVWHKATIHLPPMQTDYQIVIEGVVGDSYTGDIAVDDILMYQSCY